jgi:hypothetical protein
MGGRVHRRQGGRYPEMPAPAREARCVRCSAGEAAGGAAASGHVESRPLSRTRPPPSCAAPVCARAVVYASPASHVSVAADQRHGEPVRACGVRTLRGLACR